MYKKYFGIFITLFMLFGMAFSSTAKASGAGDQSSSPGILGQKPLSFVGITLVDGGEDVANAADIPLNPKFKVLFDKNVVNSLYWENNYKCFSMTSSSNENIPINVTKIDDTIDFSQRQNIFVQPFNSLKPGTTYRLFISPDLQAKNGVSTLGGATNGRGVTITFKTAGVAIQQATTNKSPSAQNTTQTSGGSSQQQSSTDGSVSTGDNTTTASDQINMNKEKTGRKQSKEAVQSAAAAVSSTINWLTIIGVILVLAWVVIEIYIKKKRNQKK